LKLHHEQAECEEADQKESCLGENVCFHELHIPVEFNNVTAQQTRNGSKGESSGWTLTGFDSLVGQDHSPLRLQNGTYQQLGDSLMTIRM
jgi:hypothetical protein